MHQSTINGVVSAAVSSREIARCPACAAPAGGETIKVPDHEYGLAFVAHYVECPSCGTLAQQPMPTFAELAEFYPADYHSMVHAGRIARARNAMRIKRLVKLARVDGPILDYGCGDGSFLLQAAESMPRRKFWGYEIGAKSQTRVLSGGAVTIVTGSPEDLFARLPVCGLITLNHVIEHLPDPQSIVQRLTDRLAPGGVFEGQTPAADSLERAVFGTRWSGYHAPRHTIVFSRAGLRRMLERCGLCDISTPSAFNPAGLAVSIASIAHAGPGRIRRSGLKWMSLLAMAGVLGPIDLLSGRPGIMDFVAYRPAN
jgi:SAM-dependent methyltransferase